MAAKDDPKIKAYIKWARDNGAIFDKIDYPVYFDGVCGVKASEDIESHEAFVFIPNRMLLNVEAAR